MHRIIGPLAVALLLTTLVGGAAAAHPVARSHSASTATPVAGTGSVRSISCPSVNVCWAVGWTADSIDVPGFFVEIVNGTPGQITTVPGTEGLNAVSCPTTSLCVALAAGASESYDGGESFVMIKSGKAGPVQPLTKITATDISCPTAKFCELVGVPTKPSSKVLGAVEDLVKGKPGPAHPVPVRAPHIDSALVSVSCLSKTHCVSIGDFANRTKKNYVNKMFVERVVNSKPANPTFTSGSTTEFNPTHITCTSADKCEVAGYYLTPTAAEAAFVATVTNSGIGTVRVVPGTKTADSIACTSARHCEGVGTYWANPSEPVYQAKAFTVNNGVPSTAGKVNGAASLLAIACPAGTPPCTSGGWTTGPSANDEGVVVSTKLHPRQSKASLTASPAKTATKKTKVKLSFVVKKDKSTPRASGSVTFRSGHAKLCTEKRLHSHLGDARATCTVKASKLGVGKHKLTANYDGDANYLPTTTSLDYKITK